MADAIDNNTVEAVRRLWESGDKAALPTIVDEPPKMGRLTSPQSPTYAVVQSKLLRRESVGTAGAWHDHRRVTIKVYGLKARAVAALTALGDLFNRDCVLDYGPKDASNLPRFMRWWPSGDDGDKLEEDDSTKAAQNVWVGMVSADVWSIRAR